jgi:hypothetical protein
LFLRDFVHVDERRPSFMFVMKDRLAKGEWLNLKFLDGNLRRDFDRNSAFCGGDVMNERRRIKPTATFEERQAEEAQKFKEAAEKQPPGSTARELLLRRARQAETASHINEWLTSPGLQPPKSLENLLADQKK